MISGSFIGIEIKWVAFCFILEDITIMFILLRAALTLWNKIAKIMNRNKVKMYH